MKDYYKILDVSPDASPNEIEKKYHFLMSIWHPDKVRNPAWKAEVEERAKEINEVYKILSNPQRRKSYDVQRQVEYGESNATNGKRHSSAKRGLRHSDSRKRKGQTRKRERSKHRYKWRLLVAFAFWFALVVFAFWFILAAFAVLSVFLDQRQQSSQYGESHPSSRSSVSSTTFQMTAPDFYKRGNAKFGRQDYQGALEDYTQAITLDPKNVYAYDNRGLVYARLSNYEAALADFTQAITLDPKNALVYDNRGLVYARLSNYEAALADYRKAADLYQQQRASSAYQETLHQIKKLR